jgi:hypothetical protein
MLEMTEEYEKRSDSQELGDLLALAEKVQASYESSARRETLWRLIVTVLVTAGVVAAVVGLGTTAPTGAWVGAGAFLVFYGAAINLLMIQRFRRRSRSDRIALREVLTLLHEIESVKAAESEWTPLQRAEFRIRLSRFELEEPESFGELLRGTVRGAWR